VIEAEASECVAELNGNDAYWKYIDILFSKKDFQTQPTKFLDPTQLPIIAASLGVNKTKFNECLTSKKYEPLVADETKNAQASGASGTPFSFIISKAVINNDVIKMVEDINNQYLGQSPTSADIIFISKDKHTIVVGGALPQQLMTPIIDSLVKSN
jgi:protein-disulfide isomerase